MQLSAQQKDAVEHTGTPALVIAGAGSGKTRTLTAKITWLINQGVDPRRILAITFTNKAAEEMKSRLIKLTGLHRTEFPWVRTYHSACYAILKQHCHRIGYKSPLQIYSAYHQKKTIKDLAMEMNIDKKHVPAILSDISKAKNSGNVNRFFDTMPRIQASRARNIYPRYEAVLKEKNALDFDNILVLARDLLRDDEELRTMYREKFQYIMVDEYQDTNNIQDEITSLLLGHGNLFCVGDDWQAVYGFRGSNVNHFLSFPDKYENARLFRLEQNYRSADEIVQLANDLIDNNSNRMDKHCFSDKRGGIVENYNFYNEFEEADWVARKVRSMEELGIKLDDMVVMYRTKSCSLRFEKAFRQMGIPYQMKGSKGFFERKEVLDINCYLIASAFQDDDVAFERIINTPKRGIGPSMLKKLYQARVENMSLQRTARMFLRERVLTPKLHKAMSDLLEGLDHIREMAPEAAIEETLSRFGYMDHLEGYCKTREEFDSRKDNLAELVHTASLKDTLEDYLEDVTLVNEDKEDDDDNKQGVCLSTIHASKGLEYMTAFVVGLEEQLFPHFRSLDSDMELEEERRLMYVAITRAEKYLYLTSAENRRGKRARRSRFLGEIRHALD